MGRAAVLPGTEFPYPRRLDAGVQLACLAFGNSEAKRGPGSSPGRFSAKTTQPDLLYRTDFATASSTPLTNLVSRRSKKAWATSRYSAIAVPVGTSGRASSS